MRAYIFLFVTLLGLSSCNKFLDETPKGTLIPKTIEDFGLIFDSQGILSSNKIDAGAGIMSMMDDDVKVTTDEIKAANYNIWGLKSYRWEEQIFTISENDPDYNALYHIIYLCNYVLNHLEEAKEGGYFSKKYVEGAARFHRAFSYFYLVNLYAKHYDAQTATTDLGVALTLEADLNAKIGRSSVEQVYEQILEDALKAKDLLENEVEAEYTFRPSKAAAYALLARIYLYRGEYTECWKSARKAREIMDEPSDYNDLEKYDGEDGNPDEGIEGLPYNNYELVG